MIWVSYASDDCASPWLRVRSFPAISTESVINMSCSCLRCSVFDQMAARRGGWAMSDFERVRAWPLAFFQSKRFRIHHWIHPSPVHLAMDCCCELGNHIVPRFLPVRRSIAPVFQVLILAFDDTDLLVFSIFPIAPRPTQDAPTIRTFVLNSLSTVLEGSTIYFSLQR